MHLVRCLTSYLALYDMTLFAVHLPGKDNTAVSALSRDNLPLFRQQINNTAEQPTPLPTEVILALVTNQPDWTSKS